LRSKASENNFEIALTYFDPEELLKQEGIKRNPQNFGQQPQKGSPQGNIQENESFGRNLDYVEESTRQENPKRDAQILSDQPERGPRESRETRETREARETREGAPPVRNRLASHSPEIKISGPQDENEIEAEAEESFGYPKKSPVTSLAELENPKPEPKERSKTKKSVMPTSSQKNESETGADIRGDVQERKYFTAAKPPRSIDMSPKQRVYFFSLMRFLSK